ncbi:MAG: monovalent cation/H+ antiporter subunit D family protein [Burkholderiales bacterium]|nr:monovalent cation/H+ antiporter subunit D family protein [Burkholderiales bacterium]
MIADHLPILQVMLPLLAAPLIVLLRHATLAWLLTVAVSWVSFVIALVLFFAVPDGGAIYYELGSWPMPWGIGYRIDAASAYVLVLVSLIASVVAPYARVSVAAEVARERHYLFYAMLVLCLGGLLGIAATNDAFNLFVFLEISSLSSYVLIAIGRNRRAFHASFQYLIMGTIGATFYVIGVGLLYLMTGTLNLADMAERLGSVQETRPVLSALAFITVGLSLKIALFPLHFWLPNAYACAPSVVSAFLAGTATKVSVYVLMRFLFSVFGNRLSLDALHLFDALIVLSIAATVVASLVALYQTDLKRMLAYSSVAQVGYISLGIALNNADGLTASVIHLFNHGVTKVALFMLAGGIMLRLGTTRFDSMAGLARRMPLTAFGFVVAGLSLIGVPASAGFVTKWYLVMAALERGQWWLAALVVATSLISALYVWRFVEMAYLREPVGEVKRVEAPLAMLIPAWIMVVACTYFGLETSYSLTGAQEAAMALTRGFK